MELKDREFFERLMSLTEENNRMLHRMRRASILAGIGRLVYWLILVGISVGAYYYIQPYIDQLITTYNSVQHATTSLQGMVAPFSRQ